MNEWLPTILATVAGILSTASFVPQVLKAWRERDTAAISKRMYLVTVTAFTLWSVYGFLIGAMPLIVFNLLSLGLSGTILFLKIRNERQKTGRQKTGSQNTGSQVTRTGKSAAVAEKEPGMAQSG
ncbi:SemiSWEET family sugar transporter [Microvirga sp. TS319]|uniref:SemiSWEET family sugar transporter n=1 Tax=Microvirga sp. TS319 TaxID=3241165 RepID=UPI00351A7C4D